jgi:hypothetical protein
VWSHFPQLWKVEKKWEACVRQFSTIPVVLEWNLAFGGVWQLVVHAEKCSVSSRRLGKRKAVKLQYLFWQKGENQLNKLISQAILVSFAGSCDIVNQFCGVRGGEIATEDLRLALNSLLELGTPTQTLHTEHPSDASTPGEAVAPPISPSLCFPSFIYPHRLAVVPSHTSPSQQWLLPPNRPLLLLPLPIHN